MWAARNNDKKRINKIYRYTLYLSNYWCITLILFYTDGKLKSQMISIWLVGDKGKKWWRRMRETCWRRLDHISRWTWGCLVHWVHLQGPRAQRGDKDGAGTAGKSSGNVPLTLKPPDASGKSENPSTRTPAPCAESSALSEAWTKR